MSSTLPVLGKYDPGSFTSGRVLPNTHWLCLPSACLTPSVCLPCSIKLPHTSEQAPSQAPAGGVFCSMAITGSASWGAGDEGGLNARSCTKRLGLVQEPTLLGQCLLARPKKTAATGPGKTRPHPAACPTAIGSLSRAPSCHPFYWLGGRELSPLDSLTARVAARLHRKQLEAPQPSRYQ